MNRERTGIEITRVDSKGRGRGKTVVGDGTERDVFVAGAYRGDIVDVRVRKRKRGAFIGEVARLQRVGVERREPFCRHFALCGGCTLQDLPYEAQLDLKHQIVEAAFCEASLADVPKLPPVVGSSQTREYRNKLEFSCGAARWLSEDEVDNSDQITDRRGMGFHVAGRFDRVLDLSECHLQPYPSDYVRRCIRELAVTHDLSFYDSRAHEGLLRVVMVRTSLLGESMVTVMFGERDEESIALVMGALQEGVPDITSLNYVVNTSKNDSLFPHQVTRWSGRDWITERCGSFTLKIRPKAFYQTNPLQAETLYRTALDLIEIESDELVYDLYCGIGSITLQLARRARMVVGIETVEDAVEAARENAVDNGVQNVAFEVGEVERIFDSVVQRYGRAETVVVDPPRMGLHPTAREALRALAPRQILYISCNPRTQAQDIAALTDLYRVNALQPVDMFPHTRHVENIAVLTLREGHNG